MQKIIRIGGKIIMENELVSELYLKRENLKEAEKELWVTEDDLKRME